MTLRMASTVRTMAPCGCTSVHTRLKADQKLHVSLLAGALILRS